MYCRRCAYNLSHITSAQCPECGSKFDSSDPKSYAATERAIVLLRLRRRGCMALIVGVALLALYVVIYALLIVPELPPFMSGVQPWRKHPTYRAAEAYCEPFFRPVVAVDQRLFPRRWQHWDCPDELIDTVEFMRSSGWKQVEGDARLKQQWENLGHAVETAEWAHVKLQMINVAAHPEQAKQLENEIQRCVALALDAERLFKRSAAERPGH